MCLPGLHITLGVFTKIFKLFEDTCHELDLKLACSSSQTAASSSSFDEYHQEMLKMLSAKEDLTSQLQELNVHEQLTTYLSILYGETNEVVKGLLKQAEIKRQAIKQMVSLLHSTAVTIEELHACYNYSRKSTLKHPK